MKPLFVPLKTEYFRAFENGTKKTEYRLLGPRWNENTVIKGRQVTLSHGYSGARISGIVKRMRTMPNTITDLYPRGAMLCCIDISFA
jgi:hypothetical protein